ncbi:hypothetical protein [Pseudomonas syringae]|uniref:hypothetical protein n=1 Tax=Pseudomonas syringae TaxID=317 RepID=UPI0011B587EF|nr:hypothetical protein [Pseudomonas syringae]
MKTHELAKNLELIATLLKSAPNGDLTQTLRFFQKLVDDNTTKKASANTGRLAFTHVPNSVIESLQNMPLHEVETFLKTNALFVSTASIARLANQLGIEVSKRQSRDALINSITRNLEAGKMNSIIRNEPTTELTITADTTTDPAKDN